MPIEPVSNLLYMHKVYPLLRDLYRHEAELNESVIYSYVKRNQQELKAIDPDEIWVKTSARPSYIFDQLKKTRFLREISGHSTLYELTPFVKHIVQYYEQEHHFASSEEIEGYRRAFESLYQDLDTAYRSEHKNIIIPIIENISQKIESLRNTANSNRLATIDAVKKTKLNLEHQSSESRFIRINYIYTKYVEPLRDLIAINQPMDIALTRIENILREGADKFLIHRDISFKIEIALSSMPVLRHTLKTALSESCEEIIPLLNSLKISKFARGATFIISEVEKNGTGLVDNIMDSMELPSTRRSYDIFDGSKVLDFLFEAKKYNPRPVPTINLNRPKDEPELSLIDLGSVIEKALADLPIENAYSWVMENYQGEELLTHLKIYHFLYQKSTRCDHTDHREDFAYDSQAVSLYPISIKELK